jgi:hypothetical protein
MTEQREGMELPPLTGSAFSHGERCYVAFADGPMLGVYDARTPGEHWVWTLECGLDQPAHPRKWEAVYKTLEEAQAAHREFLSYLQNAQS